MTHPTDDEIMELAVRYFGEQAAHASTGLKRFARALLAAQPAVQQPAEDDVFSALDLSPDTFRTEGGAVNVGKLRAAIRHPLDYLPAEHWLCADTVIKAQGGKQ